MAELIFKNEVYQIVGAAMDVYYTLGRGFLEPVYQEALEIEMRHREIAFEAQRPLMIKYKGSELKKRYLADFVCFGKIIVEIKACEALTSRDESQLINYMKATGMRVGLLFNFCSTAKLEWKSYVV